MSSWRHSALRTTLLTALLACACANEDAAPHTDQGERDAAMPSLLDAAAGPMRPPGAAGRVDAGTRSDAASLDPTADLDAAASLDAASTTEHAFVDSLVPIAAAHDAGFLLADPDGDLVIRADRYIDARPDKVWALVRDVNGYARFSQNITARAEPIAVGSSIALSIQLLDPPFARTDSEETIHAVDDVLHAIAWKRAFSAEETTHRFQVVTREGTGAHYYTALHFPPMLGAIMRVTLAENTRLAFEKFAAELQTEAEKP